jgi:hypothetical protein
MQRSTFASLPHTRSRPLTKARTQTPPRRTAWANLGRDAGSPIAPVPRSTVLGFENISDVEVWGADYERLQGVFGVRMRVTSSRSSGSGRTRATPAGTARPASSSWASTTRRSWWRTPTGASPAIVTRPAFVPWAGAKTGPEQERLNNCEIHRVLKRGGRLAVAVWASLDRAPA